MSTTDTPEMDVSTQEKESRSLADFFADEGEQEAEKPEQDGKPAGDSDESESPTDLKTLAETLKTKPENLYKLKIPMANGESLTLGELKDLAAKQDDISIRELEIEETRTKREADFVKAQAELREIVSALPKTALSENFRESLRKKHEQAVREENQKTLDLIPEWKDEEFRTKEFSEIIEHMSDYGFPKTYLQTVHDSRTLRYIRDNYLRHKRVTAALERAKKGKPSTAPRSGNASTPAKPIQKASSKRQPRDQLAAFLIRNQGILQWPRPIIYQQLT